MCKQLTRHNSATVQQTSMKFGTMMYFNPLKPTRDQNFIFKHSTWHTAADLKSNKNSSGDEIANVNYFFYNIAHVEASAYAH